VDLAGLERESQGRLDAVAEPRPQLEPPAREREYAQPALAGGVGQAALGAGQDRVEPSKTGREVDENPLAAAEDARVADEQRRRGGLAGPYGVRRRRSGRTLAKRLGFQRRGAG
jgi:hypothetical protein